MRSGALSSLSPWKFEVIHFVIQMFVPEPSAKFPILHSICIPANTSKFHQCPQGSRSPSQPQKYHTCYLEMVLFALPGW